VAVRRELREETGLVDVAPLFSGACLVDRVATSSVETYGLAYAFVADPSVPLAGEAGQPAAWYPLGARPARAAKHHWARVMAQAERLRAGRPPG
jgi:8-oxo-dGTP diphosphatase